ncbi:hypothetical protein [Ammoniphilus sp. 3BR4]|uniref:hypothetical protein n=1 Tax=Ammoniphilus sp. 3BR4 TaxID=3158265 RepID=UPI003466BA8E
MYVIAGFESSLFVEFAIEELKEEGIHEKDIVMVKMENAEQYRNLFDSIHHSDGVSLFDGMAALGGAGMTLGIIVGSQIAIGPVAIGLLGLFIGAAIGYFLDKKISKVKKSTKQQQYIALLLLINCKEDQKNMVTTVFHKHDVLTLGILM